MRRSWMGMIVAGAVLCSGCSVAMGGAMPGRGAMGGGMPGQGARAGAGRAMIYVKGPVYAVSGGDTHSLATPVAWTPSPTSPLGVAPRAPIFIGPQDTPLAEWDIFGFGVKGVRGTEIRKSGLRGYLRNGLGRSLADISRNPTTIYTFVKFVIFSRDDGGSLLLY